MTDNFTTLLNALPNTFTAYEASKVWNCEITTAKARVYLLKKAKAIDLESQVQGGKFGSSKAVYVKK